jgi:hypothetical protein
MSNPFERKSEAYWIEGMACLDVECWNSAAHCLYYAVFQAVFGFAEESGLMPEFTQPYEDCFTKTMRTPSKHDVVRAVVKRWRGPKGSQPLYGLYAARIFADYKVEDVTEKQITPYVKAADSIRQFFLNYKLEQQKT